MRNVTALGLVLSACVVNSMACGDDDAGPATRDAGDHSTPVPDDGNPDGADAGQVVSNAEDASAGDAGADAGSMYAADASADAGDASPDAATMTSDAQIDAGQTDETCQEAIPLTTLEPVTGTTGASSFLVDYYEYRECYASLPGYERLYSLTIEAGQTLRARVEGDGMAVMIRPRCRDRYSIVDQCRMFGNGATYPNQSPAAVEVELLVDSHDAAEQPFTLRLSISNWSCGDGFLDYQREPIIPIEECDDGNSESGDGCSAVCTTEPAWVCSYDAPCRPVVCGDGIVDEGYEACDDGNDQESDGCDAGCQIEVGWVCESSELPCRRIVCGDGIMDERSGSGIAPVFPPVLPLPPLETCEDGNVVDGDGCDSACHLEPGWACENEAGCTQDPGRQCATALDLQAGSYDLASLAGSSSPSRRAIFSSPLPADRVLRLTGTADFDGTIALMHPDRCEPLPFSRIPFGAAIPFDVLFGPPDSMEEGEQLGDTALLQIESAGDTQPLTFVLDSIALISPSCGDGVVNAAVSEQCDDGNAIAGDGCSEGCQREAGFSCPPYEYGCRDFGCSQLRADQQCWPYVCGDEWVADRVENCEDGNTMAGDGCSSECTLEAGYSCAEGEYDYECLLHPEGDLCSNALPLPLGASAQSYDMAEMSPEPPTCNGCAVGRWFSVSQAPGETTALIFRGDLNGYVHTFVGHCPFAHEEQGDGFGPRYILRRRIQNSTLSARSLFIEVFAPNPLGSFELLSKTGPGGCGDLWLDSGGAFGAAEECEDGNTADADGCSAQCRIEAGYTCLGEPSTCIPD